MERYIRFMIMFLEEPPLFLGENNMLIIADNIEYKSM